MTTSSRKNDRAVRRRAGRRLQAPELARWGVALGAFMAADVAILGVSGAADIAAMAAVVAVGGIGASLRALVPAPSPAVEASEPPPVKVGLAPEPARG